MKPEKDYLKSLIDTTMKKFEEFEYPELDLDVAEITYLPTKKSSFSGILSGAADLSRLKANKITESTKIRSNCKNYIKRYYIDGKIVKVEKFIGGHDRIDSTYLACYDGDHRYIFPFSDRKKASWLYIYVTRFEDRRVAEEYTVKRNQIVYEKYDYSQPGVIGYYTINYVPTGKYPVLEESTGRFDADTLNYTSLEEYVWYQDRE